MQSGIPEQQHSQCHEYYKESEASKPLPETQFLMTQDCQDNIKANQRVFKKGTNFVKRTLETYYMNEWLQIPVVDRIVSGQKNPLGHFQKGLEMIIFRRVPTEWQSRPISRGIGEK
jgi:hypothetical protein